MGSQHDILRRIARQLDGKDPIEALRTTLAPRDLQSLLLDVAAARAARVTPPDLLARWERGGPLRLGLADPRALARFELAAYDAASAFEPLPLAPAVPLGATRVLAALHPNNVLTTTRQLEVLADPTTALALEAARRRRPAEARAGTVRLCATARVMRMQPLPHPGLSPHFVLFALASAGRGDDLVLAAIREHLEVHLAIVRGLAAREVTVEVSDTRVVAALLERAGLDLEAVRGRVRAHDPGMSAALLAERGIVLPRGRAAELVPTLPPPLAARVERLDHEVLAPLERSHPGTVFRVDLSRLEGLAYYAGPCLRVTLTDANGSFALGDGGALDWTARLLSDGRERLVTSGLGADLACLRFGGGRESGTT